MPDDLRQSLAPHQAEEVRRQESRLPPPNLRHPPRDLGGRPPRPEGPPPGEPGGPPPPIRTAFATVTEGGTTWRVVRLVHPRNEVMLGQDLAVLAAEDARYRNAFLLAAPLALLLLAQADAGRLGGGMEMIDWSERVRELVADTRELAPQLEVSADVAPEIKVKGDEDLLVQVLLNLAGNAVKFNQGEPGAIAVELKAEEGRAVFRIANTGPALSGEEKERIFERFYRGDPRATAGWTAWGWGSPSRARSPSPMAAS